MEITLTQSRCYFSGASPSKFTRKGMLALVLLFFQVVPSQGTVVSPADGKIALSVKSAPLRQVLQEIEQQSQLRFFYSTDQINTRRKVSINFNGPMDQMLDKLFYGTDIFWQIKGRQILLMKKKAVPLQSTAPEKQPGKTPVLPEETSSTTFHPIAKFADVPPPQKIAKGVVKDENGEGLPGVSVLVKGTQRGTITDVDGNYSIEVPNENTVLTFSFVGFVTQELVVGSRASLDVTMLVDNKALNEIVVVGFGTMRKTDLTGSIVTANLEAFKESPNINILQSLKGAIPGLDIGQTNQAGAEPSIQIRGRNTINGNRSVLIILDGIIYNGRLGDINPADIESVNILKDASSKSIYGAQAANGVILITTKSRTQNTKPTITYSTYAATQSPTSNMRLRNGEEKKQIIRDIYYQNAYLGPDYTEQNPNWTFNQTELVPENMRGIEEGTDFDWWDALTNPGFLTDHALTINGSTEKTSYYLSGGFTKQKGFLLNDNYNRSSIRININSEISKWLTVGANTFGSFTDYSGIYPDMEAMKLTSPFVKPTDENGEYLIFPSGATNIINPFLSAQAHNKDVKNRFNGTFYGIVKIPFIEGLEYRLNYSNDYMAESYFNGNQYDANLTGAIQKNNQRRLDLTIDNILSYENRFGDHGVSATIVSGYRNNEFEATSARGTNVSNISLSYNSLQQATIQQISSGGWKETFLYQMGRFNYNYQNTYMLTATMRRDGYSGFSNDNKFAVFPSVGFAWVLSNNSFLQTPKIDHLKIRASYGLNGNMTSRYSSLARVTTSDASRYVFGDGATSMGQSFSSLANNDLRWEKTNGLNFGLDFDLFNNRVSGAIDYYNNTTTDLLWNIVIPQISGFSSISSNVGKIRNTGLEILLSATLLRKKDFEWTVNFNYADNRNKILSLLGEDKNNDGKEDDLPGSNLFIGKSIGTIFDYQIQGIWQMDDEIMTGYYPGAYRIVDQNNDGTITAEHDRVFLGRTEPAYTIGVQSEMKYKNFTFRFFVNTIQGGRDGYLGANIPSNVGSTGNFANLNTFNYDLWSISNPNGKYAVGWSIPQINPTPYYSRSFIRLQDIALAYEFDNSLLKKIGMRNLKMFASGKNLWTITNWDGWDPETGQGVNSNAYPVLKSLSLGLELSF